jgi:hypothetical protein
MMATPKFTSAINAQLNNAGRHVRLTASCFNFEMKDNLHKKKIKGIFDL